MSNKNSLGRNNQNNQTTSDPFKLALDDAATKTEQAAEAVQEAAAEPVEVAETEVDAAAAEAQVVATPVIAPKVEQAPAAAQAAPSATATPVQATQAVTAAPIAFVKKVRESTPTVQVLVAPETSTEFETMIAKERKQGTITAQNLIAFLDKYVVVMKPKRPVTPTEIRQNQEGLVRTIRGLLETAPSLEFNRLWNLLVAYFREYRKGAFSPLYVNRGPEEWKRAPEDYNFLVNMTNLLMATAENGKAAAKEHVDLEKTTKTGVSADARQRLVAYYLG